MSWLAARLDRVLPKREGLRNVAVMTGGTALAQGLVVLASPLLTRLYTPEDFGLLAVFTAVLSLHCVVASLRYELAIPLPGDDGMAANLLALALGLVVTMAGLTAVWVTLFADPVTDLADIPQLRPYLWLLPLGVLAVGTYEVLRNWAVRRQAFGRIARTRVNQGIGIVVTQLSLGWAGAGPVGLLLGQVIGQAAGGSTLLAAAARHDRHALAEIDPAGVAGAARRYRRFPLIASGSGLLNTAAIQLPAVLLAVLYGPHVAGWFALGQRVIAVPMVLVGQAVAQVFFAAAARMRHGDPDALPRLFSRTALRLLLVGSVPTAVLVAGGPWLFAFVFGADWAQTGEYVRLMAAMMLMQFVALPLAQTLTIYERQDLGLLWDAASLTLAVGALAGGHALDLPHGWAVAAYGAAMFVGYVILFLMARHVLKTRQADPSL